MAAKSDVRIPIAESETPENQAKFITTNVWWNDTDQTVIDALKARWNAVSDGTNNPCPVGWRLPTSEDFYYIGSRSDFSPTGNFGTEVTVLGVTFVRKEYVGGDRVEAGRSYYWLTDDFILFSSDRFSTYQSQPWSRSSYGQYIRCVKDKAPLGKP